jgi:site-specific recombinase XerD
VSGDVGKKKSPAKRNIASAMIEVHEGVLEPPPGALVLSGVLARSDSAEAVAAYVVRHQAKRSRQNALDALRRLARLISSGRTSDPAVIPWADIGFAQAGAIRTALYEKTRTGEFTPGTANLTLSHLRGLFKTLHKMGLVSAEQREFTRDELINVRGSRKTRGRALTPDEERSLRAAAKDLEGYRGTMLDTAIVLATGAGLRREEVAELPLVGVGKKLLTVIGKGNEERLIPIDPEMGDAAHTWLKERETLAPDHVKFFCSPQSPETVLSSWAFWDLVRTTAHAAFGKGKCGEACRCVEVVTGPHDFRRTFATRLLEQGLDIRQVQLLMGHKSLETTVRYDKRDLEALFEKRRNMRVIA